MNYRPKKHTKNPEFLLDICEIYRYLCAFMVYVNFLDLMQFGGLFKLGIYKQKLQYANFSVNFWKLQKYYLCDSKS